MQTTALTAASTSAPGYPVPATRIESTVRTAAARPGAAVTPDDVEVAATARADVSTLAGAGRRRNGSAVR
jgi:hypothetical protein